MSACSDHFALFAEKAAPLSMQVCRTATWQEALARAVDLCVAKVPCEDLMPAAGEPFGGTLEPRTLAAPGLPEPWLVHLRALCANAGLVCVENQLRDHAAGLDMGLALAACAVAETATCVVESRNEDVRLATMLSEICVLLVPQTRLVNSLGETLDMLRSGFGGGEAKTANYMAFITGSSRTSDIERVLTLGVHGPLELQVLVWNDAEERA